METHLQGDQVAQNKVSKTSLELKITELLMKTTLFMKKTKNTAKCTHKMETSRVIVLAS
jgi:hypothetical protein